MSIDRRNFPRTRGITLLGSLATGSTVALTIPGTSGGEETDKKAAVASAMNHFRASEVNLEKVSITALEKGGDYADLFSEHTISNNIRLVDGAVNNSYPNTGYGVGACVLTGDQSGYVYVGNTVVEDALKVTRTAARIASANRGNKPLNLTKKELEKSYYTVAPPQEEVGLKDKMSYLQELNSRIFVLDKRVHKVQASQNDTTSHIFSCNPGGVVLHDYRPMVTLGAVRIMEEGGKAENSYAAHIYRRGSDFLSDEAVDVIVCEAVDQASLPFKATKPKGGEIPAVMGAGGSGILFHETIGCTSEANFNQKSVSIFADQLNKEIRNEHVNVVDDDTIPPNRGPANSDDEDIEGQKTYLTKDGVPTSYLRSRISTRHYEVEPTGNGRHESSRNISTPRTCATHMEARNVSESDITSSVKKGVFADNFTDGQVQTGAGDLIFLVKSGYMIEDGELIQPIKDTNTIGNGSKALADITMVATNVKIDNGTRTRGRDGQPYPVTYGMPSALASKPIAGGKNQK